MFTKDGKTLTLPTAGYGIGADATIYPAGCPAGTDGINYPAGTGPLFSPEGRAALGVVDSPDPDRADERFYWNGDLADPRPLADVLNVFWEQIKAHRDALRFSGCPVGDKWFHNDVESRSQWERMVNRAAVLADADLYLIAGQPTPWKTKDGSFVVLTAGKIREVVEAFEIREAIIFTKAEQHKAALAAQPTVEAMIAYNWRTGWPAAYGVAP